MYEFSVDFVRAGDGTLLGYCVLNRTGKPVAFEDGAALTFIGARAAIFLPLGPSDQQWRDAREAAFDRAVIFNGLHR